MNNAIPSKAVLFSAILFSFFSVVIMTYISMATPLGPWVELIVVLASTMVFRFVFGYTTSERLKNAVGLTTVAAGVAGIVAVVCGFTVPTLYFLNRELFLAWLAQPYYFSLVMGGTILAGGGFAFFMVGMFGERMLADEKLQFPVAQMVRKMILAQNQLRKALELCAGIIISFMYAFLQRCSCLIPQNFNIPSFQIISLCQIPELTIRLDILPLFVAIGYVAGAVLTIPLLVGVVTKLIIMEPLKCWYFSNLHQTDFILGFGGGMMIQGVVLSFAKVPHLIFSAYKKASVAEFIARRRWKFSTLIVLLLFLTGMVAYFWHFNFSLLSQLYMYVFAAMCVYQIMIIGGKIGLAPFGRFATFVMMPGLLLFSYDYVQVMLVSLFVSLVGGVAVDLMFGRKTAQMSEINKRDVFWMQLLGLVVSAVVFGFVFIQCVYDPDTQTLCLGSTALVAQRARARALLLSIHNLDYILLIVGGIFGYVLEYLGISALLVFTGLLFPIDFSLMLIIGGGLTFIAQDKDEWDPFWSGVFAAASFWMFMRRFF